MADLTLAEMMAMTPAQRDAYAKAAMSGAATANNTALNSLIGSGNLSTADTSRLMQGYGLPNANVVNFTNGTGTAADYGNLASAGGSFNGNVTPNPNQEYVVKVGDQVVYSGTGVAGAQGAKVVTDKLNSGMGKQAAWTVTAGTPGNAASYAPVAQSRPPESTMPGFFKTALPIAGAIVGSLLLPGVGTALGASLGLSAAGTAALSAALAGGIGAAGGTATSDIMQGKSIGNIAKDALLSGGITAATAGIGSATGATSAISSALKGLGGAGASAAPGAVASSIPSALDDIVVTGTKSVIPTLLTSGAGALAGGALNSAISGQPSNVPNTPKDISTIPTQLPVAPATGALDTPGITITGSPAPGPVAAALPGAAGAAAADEIKITGHPDKTTLTDTSSPLGDLGAAIPTTLPDTGANGTSSKLSDYLKYAKLATLLLGGLGAATSKNASSVPYTGGASGGNLDPIMHAALPTASIPGLTAETSGARTMPAQDWNLYGMRPGQSFFNNVPSTYTPPAPGQYDAYDKQRPGYQQGFADGGEVHQRLDMTPPRGPDPSPLEAVQLALHYMRGERPSLDVDVPLLGGHFGLGVDVGPNPHMRAAYSHAFAGGGPLAFVGDQGPPAPPMGRGPLSHASDQPIIARGPGGGRGDKIPSLLSDGEYVMDAETVALLGNGSIREGTQKLNDLRVNIRKQKGPAFVKGKLSPDARPAAHYMGAQ